MNLQQNAHVKREASEANSAIGGDVHSNSNPNSSHDHMSTESLLPFSKRNRMFIFNLKIAVFVVELTVMSLEFLSTIASG